jgi:hypothetical protein
VTVKEFVYGSRSWLSVFARIDGQSRIYQSKIGTREAEDPLELLKGEEKLKDAQRRAKRLEEEVKRLGGDPKSVDQDVESILVGRKERNIFNLEDAQQRQVMLEDKVKRLGEDPKGWNTFLETESWLDEVFVRTPGDYAPSPSPI